MNAKSNKGDLSNRIHRLFQSNQNPTKKRRNINAYLFGLVMLITVASFAFSKITNPTVSIAVDKMNVLYIGIDNPITVAVSGISTEETKVESEQLNIQDQGNGHYIVKAKTPGKAIIKVTAEGHAPKEIEFRVKRIPDPIAAFGNNQGGVISADRIMKSEGIDAVLYCFDYDTRCEITGYSMTYVAKGGDPVESINRSGKHSEKTLELLQNAKPGDIYYFDNVLCQCPGDSSTRPINSMVFKIR
jgi:gliding motility-associated GldM-like protein